MGRVCGVGAAIDRMYIELCRLTAEFISWSICGPIFVSRGSYYKRNFSSNPCRVVSSSYKKMVPCHGRGREFETRPRHIFNHLLPLSIRIVAHLLPKPGSILPMK
jgi:hypothetical protein